MKWQLPVVSSEPSSGFKARLFSYWSRAICSFRCSPSTCILLSAAEDALDRTDFDFHDTEDFVADFLPADAENLATETAFSAAVGFVTDFGLVTDL
jgi:hypothetical protein